MCERLSPVLWDWTVLGLVNPCVESRMLFSAEIACRNQFVKCQMCFVVWVANEFQCEKIYYTYVTRVTWGVTVWKRFLECAREFPIVLEITEFILQIMNEFQPRAFQLFIRGSAPEISLEVSGLDLFSRSHEPFIQTQYWWYLFLFLFLSDSYFHFHCILCLYCASVTRLGSVHISIFLDWH